MKAKVLLGMFAVSLFMITGCSHNHAENENTSDQAYVNESSEKDDAVNTLQIGTEYKITGPMDELRDAVVVMIGENYWPDTLLTREELAERTGISEDLYEDCLAEYQHTEAGVDMMILVEAKEESIEMVEDYLNQYREVLLRIYSGQPQNLAKVSASRMEIVDNYVCYVQLGADISNMEENGEEIMTDYCREVNEKVLDLIEKKILNT
ncbi:MAG: DUF4358 domain-containing protein [Lachnospiraceae bacterium]|nr:DUF4358 domain-containing protein [Lachnospiraceae bacterium]